MILSAKEVLDILMKGEPVSLIRAGDGEKLILDSNTSYSALELASTAVLKRQMGYEPPLNHIKEIRENLIKAYSECDIIGIPCHTQPTSKHWQEVKGTLDANVPVHSETYCSTDVGYDFLNAGYFHELLGGRKHVHYISCRNLDKQLQKTFTIHQANLFQIAPEKKFTSTYVGPNHYPDQFNKVQRWMDRVCPEGDICLVGAGVIGKIYCNWFKERGGIAMDIGSIADEWAGAVTRGPERGLDKILEDGKGYKL